LERSTVAIYEDCGETWAKSVTGDYRQAAEEFASAIPARRPIVDVGCGAGRYTGSLGKRCIGLDAARSMLDLCRQAVPDAVVVQADMESLPFAPMSLSGAWAHMSYLHLPKKRLPAALADLHRVLQVGSPVHVQVLLGEFEGTDLPEDRLGGRFFAAWSVEQLTNVVFGAGFALDTVQTAPGRPGHHEVLRVRAHRSRTLPDTVGPGMRLLVCGLNPSVYSADKGIGFARPGNRFWPAALASGLVTRERDPRNVLAVDCVGMTDIVKRATPNAAQLTNEEYKSGTDRVERLVEWLEPSAVCFVGLAGWRAVVDRKAVAGVQERLFGGRPAYVMPSTSGLNANSRLDDLTAHFRRALSLADQSS
jgi:TDG/mug DNA glycosylase family protein